MADRARSPHLDDDRQGKGKKGLLKEQLEMVKVRLPDGRTRYSLKPISETLTFDKGFYVFVRAIQMLKSSNEGTIMVGLAGPSGSGKTAFSEKIKDFIPGVAVISMDMYNDGSKVIDDNFDDPRLTDYETLMQNLSDLRNGKVVQVPVYDFKTSTRVGYREQAVPESRVVVLEGIYALSERLRPLMDLRVSIQGGVHFDLVKRVMRDISRAGQSPEEIVQQITDTVYPMYKAFIEPDLKTAHLKIINSFNPFSGFMSPTYILKSRKVPPLEDIMRVLEEVGPARQRREVDIYDIYLLPPQEDPETCVSWLRMRNRDGRYSLMFEEWVVEDPFIISPRISFEVNVRILGGLMALGYEIGTIMRRTSQIVALDGDELQVKLDEVEGLGHFIQILGRDRTKVAAVGKQLGLEGSYIARSYIEQVQLGKLTSDFQTVTEDWRRRFATRGGEFMLPQELSQGHGGSPSRSFGRSISYAGSPSVAQLSTSAPVSVPFPRPPTSRSGSSAAHGGDEGNAPRSPIDGPSTSTCSITAGASGNGHNDHHLRSTGNNNRSVGDYSGNHHLLHGGRVVGPGEPSPTSIGRLFQERMRGAEAATAAATSSPFDGGRGRGNGGGDDDVDDILGRMSLEGVAGVVDSLLAEGMGENPGPFTISRTAAGAGAGGRTNNHHAHGRGNGGNNGNGGNGSGIGGNIGMGALSRRVDALASDLQRLDGLQVQLDAMAVQYRQTNEQLQALASTTAQLATGVQALATSVREGYGSGSGGGPGVAAGGGGMAARRGYYAAALTGALLTAGAAALVVVGLTSSKRLSFSATPR